MFSITGCRIVSNNFRQRKNDFLLISGCWNAEKLLKFKQKRINNIRFVHNQIVKYENYNSLSQEYSKSKMKKFFYQRKLLLQCDCLMPLSVRLISSSPKHPIGEDVLNDYKGALSLLNQLPSNHQAIRDIEKRLSERSHNVENTRYYLSLLGITDRDLNRLNVIHVAGTKGKGSTCAYVESILRENGYKTGFFSSPHLVVPRERIRINGQMISEQKFSEFVQHVFYMLKEHSEIQLPAYFNFFCVMSFYVFVRERVDVAIMEVGIGGEYDSTNVVQKPICTGITSLDLDHCNILGTTLEQIAWHKAGIFKKEVAAFTVEQKPEAMSVLKERSEEKGCPLFVVPQWSLYPYANHIKLGINGDVQKLNASLAVQLAHYWINKRADSMHLVAKLLTSQGVFADVISLKTNNYIQGLENTKWYGRCETVETGRITYFLDGAHTNDSMEACVKWFLEESNHPKVVNGTVNGEAVNDFSEKMVNSNASATVSTTATAAAATTTTTTTTSSGKHGIAAFLSKLSHHHHSNHNQNCTIPEVKAFRIMVFNCTGNRDPSSLLSKLKNINFNLAIFTTNIVYKDKDNAERLERERDIASTNTNIWTSFGCKTPISRVDSIHNAVQLIESYQSKTDLPIHVLVTGSVYLAGGFVALVHPEFAQTSTKF